LVRYDSLLVRELARELDDALRGRPASALRLDPDARRASLELADGALLLELHPTRGWILLGSAPPAAPDVRRLHRSSRVRGVSAPPDERLLRIELDGSTSETRPIRSIVVELMTNQLNLLALDDDDRIVAALWPRNAGGRDLRPGRHYTPPTASARQAVHEPLSDDAFRAFQYGRDPAASLVRNIAWTSTLNAHALATYDDYVRLLFGPARPALVRRADGAVQPYPQPLDDDATSAPSLLDAMRRAAGAPAAVASESSVDPELIDRVRREITRIAARIERLEAQQERALPQARALRAQGDVLLARLHEVKRGATRVSLADFEGGTLELTLDPKLSPAENARAFYDAARKRERAAERLPAVIADARARVGALESLVARAEAGAATTQDVEAALPPATPVDAKGEEVVLPYRRYVTSGGLEVRVGRSSRANDELTFHHSSPNDVWLHARDVAGAHVVLRWPDKEANPPQRDLAEAAVLAALHSKSRTSGTVAVDWTRRKYVRKPRKSKPGSVLLERAKTLFVEPNEAVERRMRAL